MKKNVCVDLDGVLADYSKGWQGVEVIGDPIPGAVEFTKSLSEFADVVVFTTRCNPEVNKPEAAHLLVNRVREWLDKHGFRYADIYCGTGKPIASAYIDDRAITCRPQEGPKEDVPFTFWTAEIHAKRLCEK
jgi:hypothetical protein